LDQSIEHWKNQDKRNLFGKSFPNKETLTCGFRKLIMLQLQISEWFSRGLSFGLRGKGKKEFLDNRTSTLLFSGSGRRNKMIEVFLEGDRLAEKKNLYFFLNVIAYMEIRCKYNVMLSSFKGFNEICTRSVLFHSSLSK
jgi:hypothetical protein